MSNVRRLDPYKVDRIESLGMPNDVEAKSILEKIAYQVQPIMRKRQFTCPVLKEFFPSRTNLLGINVGGGGGNTQEICVRLRPASRPNTFLHYESILGTMLHELSHNIHGAHAAPFYKLLEELTAECEELMAKGIGGSGAGYDAPAAGKVGGRFIGRGDQLSIFDRREAALKAAEQRAKRQALMYSGPRKLGEDKTGLRDLPPALAAAAAAERRALDNRWCPTEQLSQDIDDGASIHAALQAVLDGRCINNAGPSSPSVDKLNNKGSNSKQQHQVSAPPPSAPHGSTDNGNDIIDLTNSQPDHLEPNPSTRNAQPQPSTEWECPSCTFINTKPLALQCDICGDIQPTNPTAVGTTTSNSLKNHISSSPPLRLD